MIVGLTSGCFDLIHYGYVIYLERCKALCDKLIVGIDCDNLVKKTKGDKRPIIPEQERLAMVNNLAPVNSAFIVKQLEDLHTMAIHFNVNKVFKHEGFKKIKWVVGVEGTSAELVIVPDVPGLVSTSEIIERVLVRYKEA